MTNRFKVRTRTYLIHLAIISLRRKGILSFHRLLVGSIYLRKCRCNAYGKGLKDDKNAHIIGLSFTRTGPSEIAHDFWLQEGDRTLLVNFKLKLKLHGKVAVT